MPLCLKIFSGLLMKIIRRLNETLITLRFILRKSVGFGLLELVSTTELSPLRDSPPYGGCESFFS
jgi:hypothetical protein